MDRLLASSRNILNDIKCIMQLYGRKFLIRSKNAICRTIRSFIKTMFYMHILNIREMILLPIWLKWLPIPGQRNGGQLRSRCRILLLTEKKGNGGQIWKRYFMWIDPEYCPLFIIIAKENTK